MDIPPEVKLKGSIQPGSVYYFPEEKFSSSNSHYFVVLNIDPLSDEVLLLVCASSQVEKVKEYCASLQLSKKTLVIVSPEEYECFTKKTIFNCNDLKIKTIQQLVDKLKRGKLVLKAEMDETLVKKLRKAALRSPIITNKHKKMLGN